MPAQIEQLYRTTLRAAVETALGNGEPVDDDWRHLPVTGAAVERVIITAAERKNVFMQGTKREVVSQAWMIRTAHEGSLDFLLWLLLPHFTNRGSDLYTLDPEAEGPSYVIEALSEAGELQRFFGCQAKEIQIFMEERRIVQIEVTWAALERDAFIPGAPLYRPTAEFSGALMPTRACGLAVTDSTWGTDPRVDNAVTFHGGQIFLTREIKTRNHGPDGIAETMERAAWKVMVELFMPETPGITDAAFADEWTGKIALWLGAGPEHFRIEQARGFIDDEDLKAYDWRVRRLVAASESDSLRCLAQFRA